ncbi:hypothetical protein FE810_04520 [Thalassotalea litorea]|uniref:DUF2268 domain-containing protein n=1 Tax=Thalassotalea litorea TaxID=2020715 RepID=A0A5R9IRT9_9GAMM|nr:hypothetical protein [Thalassotalea litorea]TLU66777.1 hypothetical protein FE810_04520 [Thalassotalea litorea]
MPVSRHTRLLSSLLVVLSVVISTQLNAEGQSEIAIKRAKFFANEQLQQQAPGAFVLQPQAREFVNSAEQKTYQQADDLVTAILAHPLLNKAITKWPELTIEQQIPYLKEIFKLEHQVLNIEPPTLLIDTTTYPNRAVNFVFKTDFSGKIIDTGTVYLNPEKLKSQPHYGPLAFVIHETRHSYQYQLAQLDQSDALSQGYKQAFIAQKQLSGFSFSDFLTLNNEYEAFLFGNYVVGRLTNWQVDMVNMGTFASQFDNKGVLKINLKAMAKKHAARQSILPAYNRAAETQFRLRK